MIIATIIVILSGLWLFAVGIVILFNPMMATRFIGKMASTSLINYTEISLRIVAGVGLVVCAEVALYPEFFQLFGWLLIVTSGVLLVIPRAWHAGYALYWSKRLTSVMVRLCAPVSMIMGVLLIHGVFSRII